MRVELQAEVPGRRADLFALVSTAEGLGRWLDEAEMTSTVGAPVRLRLHEGVAVGRVLALDPPQHLSLSWDWEAQPVGSSGVVAFDLIDHGDRTHLSLRHVGLASAGEAQLHEQLWRYWLGGVVVAARGGRPRPPTGAPAA